MINNDQLPSTKMKIMTNNQAPISKMETMTAFEIYCCFLFGYCNLVIGHFNNRMFICHLN